MKIMQEKSTIAINQFKFVLKYMTTNKSITGAPLSRK